MNSLFGRLRQPCCVSLTFNSQCALIHTVCLTCYNKQSSLHDGDKNTASLFTSSNRQTAELKAVYFECLSKVVIYVRVYLSDIFKAWRWTLTSSRTAGDAVSGFSAGIEKTLESAERFMPTVCSHRTPFYCLTPQQGLFFQLKQIFEVWFFMTVIKWVSVLIKICIELLYKIKNQLKVIIKGT